MSVIHARVAAYQPGQWFEAQSIDEMEAFYRSRLPAMRQAARTHGYALGQHGSMRRDMDLIAMPWRENASEKNVLVHALSRAACGLGRTKDRDYDWEQKPAGRVATSFPICTTTWFDMISAGHVDISVLELPAPVVKVLQFYADPENYEDNSRDRDDGSVDDYPPVVLFEDRGEKARELLQALGLK